MRWGLIPFWARQADLNRLTFNARSEEIAEKPTFREALKSRRCLVPANAFYEWKRLEKQKQPYAIALSSQQPFAFAGLWDRWRGRDGTTIESFTIATTAANELMTTLHDRMPCILSPGDYRTWLEPGDPAHPPVDLLRPAAAQNMLCWPVDQRVGNVRNNDPQLVKPIAPTPAPAMNLSLFPE